LLKFLGQYLLYIGGSVSRNIELGRKYTVRKPYTRHDDVDDVALTYNMAESPQFQLDRL